MLLFIFISVISCSNNKNTNLKFNFDEYMNLEEYKKKLIEYGMSSEFPDIK